MTSGGENVVVKQQPPIKVRGFLISVSLPDRQSRGEHQRRAGVEAENWSRRQQQPASAADGRLREGDSSVVVGVCRQREFLHAMAANLKPVIVGGVPLVRIGVCADGNFA